MEEQRNNRREEVYSKRIKAGKRTYFFDVKATRGNDYYITITESKRKQGGYGYSKHKIFLYKEDFLKFVDGLNEAVSHVRTDLLPDYDFERHNQENSGMEDSYSADEFVDFDFEEEELEETREPQ